MFLFPQRIQLLGSLYKHLTNDNINWTAKKKKNFNRNLKDSIFFNITRKSKIHKNNFLYKNGLNKWDEDTEEHSGKENKVSRK